ncbi:MAG: ATP-binding protein [Sulfolobaceae archaeon]
MFRSFSFIFLFVIPIFILFIILLFNRLYRIKKIINKININKNIFEYTEGNDVYYGIALKMLMKVENSLDQGKIVGSYLGELENLINMLSKKESNIELYILTQIKRKAGSTLLIISNNKETLEREALEIINLAEVIAPHISLTPIKVSDVKFIPKPVTFGNFPYVIIKDAIYDSPSIQFRVVTEFDIPIGYQQNTVVGIKFEDLFRHVSIFGTTGSGKSNTAKVLINEVKKMGANILVLDWHGEYLDLVNKGFRVYNSNSPLRINPLDLVNIDVDDVIDILGDVLQLSDPQRFLLSITLYKMKRLGKFDSSNLVTTLLESEDHSYWMRETKFALLRKLSPIFSSYANKLFDSTQNFDNLIENINNNIIIDLSWIRNLKLKLIYSLFLIRLITEIYIRKKRENQLIIVIEEAHNYFKDDESFLTRLLAEIRKYRIGFVIISQSPSSISASILKNTSIRIVHSIKSDIDKKVIRDSLGLDEKLYKNLDKLEIGEAILDAPNLKIPIVIKIKKFD